MEIGIYIHKKLLYNKLNNIYRRKKMSNNTKETGKKAVKTISIMAIIILLAKFMGLFRETMIANIYGQGTESDILNTATQIPLLFFDMVLGVAILSTFIPVFNKRLTNDGKENAIDFANNYATVVGSVAMVVALLGVIFAEPLVRLMTPGYGDVPGKVEQTASLLRILFPSIVFTAVAYIAVGILQSFEEFTVPSLISVVSNGIMIGYLFVFGDNLGLGGVAVSMLIAWGAQLIVQIPWLKKTGYRYKFRFDLKDSGIKEAALIAISVLISSWIQPLCNVINMSFGSRLGDGAVSALNWANKIYIIMVGVFAYAITNFVFPKLSRLGAEDEEQGFIKMTRMSVGWILFIIVLVAALFLALSTPIIKIIFERGAFTPEATQITATALFYYSFGMAGYAVCEVLNKSFYAIQDGKTPMYTSIMGIIVNLGGAYIFTKVLDMGVGGLALASAVSSISIAIGLMYMINRRRRGVISLEFILDILKMFICGCLAYLMAKWVYIGTKAMDGGMVITFARLFVSAIPSAIVYIGMAYILGVSEVKQVTEGLRKQGKR